MEDNEEQQIFLLKWDNLNSQMMMSFREFYSQQILTDCSVFGSDGKGPLKCHKVIFIFIIIMYDKCFLGCLISRYRLFQEAFHERMHSGGAN